MLHSAWVAAIGLSMALQDGHLRPADDIVEDVVVTASRDAPAFQPFSAFEEICFDGNRLERSARKPQADDPLWIALTSQERGLVGVVDSRIAAFRQERADVSLLLKIDEQEIDGLTQNRCHIIVVGQHEPEALARGMRRLFSTEGGRAPVGRVKGYEDMPGWQQWAWTAMPGKDTTRWEGFEASEGGYYVVVAEPFFYRRNAWVIGDLRFTEERGVRVSELILTLRYKP